MRLRTEPLVVCLVLSGLLGCSNVVTPPVDPSRPTEVLLLDHGRHASLALLDDGRLVRYEYGDWRWFALADRRFRTAVGALFGDSPSTLGREIVPGTTDREELTKALRVPVRELFSLRVSNDDVESLSRRLGDLFRDRLATAVENPRSGLLFVRHPEPYRFGRNSNHKVAEWLRELGCEVRVPTPFSRWRVEIPERDPPTEAVED